MGDSLAPQPAAAAGGAPLVVSGRSVEDGLPVRVTIRDGLIAAIERPAEVADGTWVAPGWLDLQVNGYGGHDPSVEGVDASATMAMVRALWLIVDAFASDSVNVPVSEFSTLPFASKAT